MPFFTTRDGCRIHFVDGHSGLPGKPPVVFLNGTSQTAVNWLTVANILGNDFRTIAYDARAQGRSGRGDLPPSIETHSTDLRALFEHLDIQKAHLVGLSHGALVALVFAARFPEVSDRLVLCSISAIPTRRAVLAKRSWLKMVRYCGVETMSEAFLPFVFGEAFLRRNRTMLDKIARAIALRNGKTNLLAQLEAMEHDAAPAVIATDVQSPVLVLSGSDDPLVTAEGAEELARLCRGRHQRLAGSGHSLPAEIPETFTAVVRRFLVPDP